MNMVRGSWVSVLFGAVLSGCGGGAEELSPARSPNEVSAPSEPVASAEPAAEKGGGSEVDRAERAIQSGEFARAKALLEKALEVTPRDATASYYMGVCLERLGDPAAAETHYERALAIEPGLTEAAMNLGALYLDQRKLDRAVAVTEKALSRHPGDPGLHANLAMALQAKGDRESALRHYEQAVRQAGDNPSLRFSYGSLLLEAGQKEKAATVLKAGLASAGADRALLASLGRVLGPAGAFAECVQAFDRAIKLGDDAELRVRRGICRHSLRDEAGAKADFESAVQQNPKFGPAHYYLGEALVALGQFPRAAKEFDLAASNAEGDLARRAREQAESARKRSSSRR